FGDGVWYPGGGWVRVSRVGSPLNGAVSTLLPPKILVKPLKPSCDGLRIGLAVESPGVSGSLLVRAGAAVLTPLSSPGVRIRLASMGSGLAFLRAAIAALRRASSGSFGQFGAFVSADVPAAGGGKSILGGTTSGDRSR